MMENKYGETWRNELKEWAEHIRDIHKYNLSCPNACSGSLIRTLNNTNH
jgi:hypothetical protein